jgi:hypothetical protein
MFDYSDRDSQTSYNKTIDQVNIAFSALFIFEAAIKIIAKGLVMHRESYLRKGWNIIDFAVVVSG